MGHEQRRVHKHRAKMRKGKSIGRGLREIKEREAVKNEELMTEKIIKTNRERQRNKKP